MKKIIPLLILSLTLACQSKNQNNLSKEGTQMEMYEENWESLKNYEIPQWMKDAKFGIFIHWGPNSVAERYTDWYPRWMYLDSGIVNPQTNKVVNNNAHPAVAYHREKFGDQKDFGFKDMIPLWTMENFDPKTWVNLFKQSGAQYVIPVAEHHDGFALYESTITPYNAVDMGPKRDVLKELTDEIKKQGLICGVSSHLAFNYNYYNQQPYFDTGNPRYADLYGPPHTMGDSVSTEWLADVWWPRTKEIIDNYQPDILWFDFYLDRAEFAPYHKKLATYYYNSGIERNKSVVLQTKNLHYKSYPEGTHMLDLERSKMDSLRRDYWQTDTSIGKNSWYYSKNWIPKDAGSLIADLMDIVSKNGCLLLNIGPRKDGIIPEDQKKTLLEIGQWLEINGEAVYGSTYWEVYGEGPTRTATGHLSENKNKGFTQEDIRFTTNEDALYATVLVPPTEDVQIKYLTNSKIDISSIQLLGYDGNIEFEQSAGGTSIKLPKDTDLKHALVFKIIKAKPQTNNLSAH
ncbi:alpha-L-fucosidase [Echinicola strongylocentroti]|uniref:alpha-L-fucosidase n=1 Tax=Echinicola strongylocentroti TaxID=1795355 RepID=A0A2Z4IEU1_9BACT|nr:alpha-L-fucosidase [Echinicola strongylocentroti]AWW29602.1 alpha-L-fucosidase [Echinicola strongylocentroti]